jgi:hypothetical protein
MKIPGRIVSISPALSVFLLLASLPSQAQMRTVPAAHPVAQPIRVRPSATHGIAVPRARINTAVPPSAHARTPITPANVFGKTFEAGGGETLQQLLDPVPGPGFNYAHVAAIDRDLAIKAIIDPETQWRLAVAERVLRNTGGFASPGYYLLDGGGEYIVPVAPGASEYQPSQTPTIVVLQQPAQPSAPVPAPTATPQLPAPIPDVGHFTLILQSGKELQAIAFMRSGDRIVYIAADGERHTIAASELDNAATQRVNEDSGAQLRL